jgi:GT2 family glycosyltransferase
LDALERQPAFTFAASRLLLADGSGRIDSAGDGFDPYFGGVMLGHGQPDGPEFDEPREVFSASGAACIYQRQVIEELGGLDESLFMYCDDVDLGFRARLRGYRCLYVPDAVVYHERGASFGRNSPRMVRFMYRNGLTVYLKNMPWPVISSVWPRLLRTWIGALRHAPHHGAALHGVLEAFLRLPDTLRKRRKIQRNRVVSVQQLRTVMTESTRL